VHNNLPNNQTTNLCVVAVILTTKNTLDTMDSLQEPRQLGPDSPPDLHATVKRDVYTAIGLLLKHGANVNAADTSGKTLLLLAVQELDYRMVELLLQHGANVHAADNCGTTPLLWATTHRNAEMVADLLANGANMHVVDGTGMTPLLWAIRDHDPEMGALLGCMDPTRTDCCGRETSADDTTYHNGTYCVDCRHEQFHG
jgi:ankyrin repeat protein